MITAKVIMIAERLIKQPFSKFDFSDNDTIEALLYGMSLSDGDTYTLKGFKLLLKNKKTNRKLMRNLAESIQFLSQFSTSEEAKECDPIFITEIASTLIASGLDADYVMNRMLLFEIEPLMKALSEKKKMQLEENRLWTFYQVLPYAEKKLKKPSDLILFSWEKEAEEKARENEFEKGIDMFNKFYKSKPIHHE